MQRIYQPRALESGFESRACMPHTLYFAEGLALFGRGLRRKRLHVPVAASAFDSTQHALSRPGTNTISILFVPLARPFHLNDRQWCSCLQQQKPSRGVREQNISAVLLCLYRSSMPKLARKRFTGWRISDFFYSVHERHHS